LWLLVVVVVVVVVRLLLLLPLLLLLLLHRLHPLHTSPGVLSKLRHHHPSLPPSLPPSLRAIKTTIPPLRDWIEVRGEE